MFAGVEDWKGTRGSRKGSSEAYNRYSDTEVVRHRGHCSRDPIINQGDRKVWRDNEEVGNSRGGVCYCEKR